jgi:iron complex transport system substrate-binding protein
MQKDSREDAKARSLDDAAISVVDCVHELFSKKILTYFCLLNFLFGLLIKFGASIFKGVVKRILNKHINFASSRLRVNQNHSTSDTI